jgi:hypothetical protein
MPETATVRKPASLITVSAGVKGVTYKLATPAVRKLEAAWEVLAVISDVLPGDLAEEATVVQGTLRALMDKIAAESA